MDGMRVIVEGSFWESQQGPDVRTPEAHPQIMQDAQNDTPTMKNIAKAGRSRTANSVLSQRLLRGIQQEAGNSSTRKVKIFIPK